MRNIINSFVIIITNTFIVITSVAINYITIYYYSINTIIRLLCVHYINLFSVNLRFTTQNSSNCTKYQEQAQRLAGPV